MVLPADMRNARPWSVFDVIRPTENSSLLVTAPSAKDDACSVATCGKSAALLAEAELDSTASMSPLVEDNTCSVAVRGTPAALLAEGKLNGTACSVALW